MTSPRGSDVIPRGVTTPPHPPPSLNPPPPPPNYFTLAGLPPPPSNIALCPRDDVTWGGLTSFFGVFPHTPQSFFWGPVPVPSHPPPVTSGLDPVQ